MQFMKFVFLVISFSLFCLHHSVRAQSSSSPEEAEIIRRLIQSVPEINVLKSGASFATKEKDEPLVPEWVAKDLEGAKWIGQLMPLEKQTIGSIKKILKVDTSTEDERYGFGARRFYIGHGNGYTRFYVDAFAFNGVIGYYKTGIESDTKRWKTIRNDVIKAWRESGGPDFVETDDGLFYTQTFDEVIEEYKNTVNRHLGNLRSVEVPAELRSYYEYLIAPLEKSTIGEGGCGLPLPGSFPSLLDGREAIDALVNANRTDLIENVLRGYNPGGRIYALLALRNLKRQGFKLSKQTQITMNKVLNLPIEVSHCMGCIVMSGLTAKDIVQYYKQYGNRDEGDRPVFIRKAIVK